VTDVVDHPLGDEELGQLGQAPGGKGQVMRMSTPFGPTVAIGFGPT